MGSVRDGKAILNTGHRRSARLTISGWTGPTSGKTDPDGSDGNIHGEGDDDSYGYNYAAALSEANERGNAALYVVKVSADANKMSDLAKERTPSPARNTTERPRKI